MKMKIRVLVDVECVASSETDARMFALRRVALVVTPNLLWTRNDA